MMVAQGEELVAAMPPGLGVGRPDENRWTIDGASRPEVNDGGGTAWRSRLDVVRFAGKTGTAQVVRRKSDEEEEDVLEKIPYQEQRRRRVQHWFLLLLRALALALLARPSVGTMQGLEMV